MKKKHVLSVEEKEERVIIKKQFLSSKIGIDLVKLVNQKSFEIFKEYGSFDFRYNLSALYDYFTNEYGLSILDINCLLSIKDSYYKRLRRLKVYITYMFIYHESVYFLTLTFRDDILNNTCENTRRRYIQRILNDHCYYYCANIDFGNKNEREHYHACVVFKDNTIINLFKDLYNTNYGFCCVQRVGKTNNDKEALSKYINKLTNHAFKKTTIAKRVIYSKNDLIYLPGNL